jgi:hypothetical protein
MSQETDVLLRTILYQVEVAESLEEVKSAIRVMCTKDVIAAVQQQVSEIKGIKKQGK